VLYGTYARYLTVDEDTFNERMALVDRAWGTGQYILSRFIPRGLADDRMRDVVARLERQSASPSAVIAILQMNREIDVRHILPAIRVPTLVMHRTGDTAHPVDGAPRTRSAAHGAHREQGHAPARPRRNASKAARRRVR
jgi:pimeloyl-ACP methyl ester carboxylesterase